jgi:hypothetical protein
VEIDWLVHLQFLVIDAVPAHFAWTVRSRWPATLRFEAVLECGAIIIIGSTERAVTEPRRGVDSNIDAGPVPTVQDNVCELGVSAWQTLRQGQYVLGNRRAEKVLNDELVVYVTALGGALLQAVNRRREQPAHGDENEYGTMHLVARKVEFHAGLGEIMSLNGPGR